MPKRSQIAVLSTAHPSLISLLFGGLNLDDFPAGIAATGKTNVMRSLRTVTLRAIRYSRKGQPEVVAPFTSTRLGVFSFR